MGAQDALTSLYQTLSLGCIVWLYDASSSSMWWFSEHAFFSCLMSGSLEKKTYRSRTQINRHYRQSSQQYGLGQP